MAGMLEKISEILNSKEKSEWYYVYTENPAALGLDPDDLRAFKQGFESKAPDGFVIGNDEILAAVGCPTYTAESIYEFYNQPGQNNEDIDLNMYPSRLSVLVGPHKKYEHLKVLFNQVRFQDYVISYKDDGAANRSHIMPLWKFPNRLLYRVRKSRIIIAEIFNEDLRIQIITYAFKQRKKEDLPLIPQIIIIENLSKHEISDVKIGYTLANYGKNWKIRQNKQRRCLSIKQGINECEWHVLYTRQNDSSDGSEPFFLEFADCDDEKDFEEEINSISNFSNDPHNPGSKEDIIFENVGFGILVQDIGDLRPRDSEIRSFTSLLTATEREFDDAMLSLDASEFYSEEFDHYLLLKNAIEEAEHWYDKVPVSVSEQKIEDLIDSLLTLLRCIGGKKAIHVGTLYYPHDSAFWRDNFWLQNAFLKSGRYEYVQRDLNFFKSAWKQDGFKNSYRISSKRGHSGGSRELRSEIAFYPALMSKNLCTWNSGVSLDQLSYGMIKEGLEAGLTSDNNAFILNSDETWIWPAYVNEHDYYIDNSFIALKAYKSGMKIAHDLNKQEDQNNWREKFDKILNGIEQNFLLSSQYRFGLGIDNNGLKDESLVPTLQGRPFLLDLTSDLDQICRKNMSITAKHALYNGLSLIWDIMSPRGKIHSHTRTAAIEGNTIGHYLYACSDLDVEYMDAVLNKAIEFSNCTGSVNEIHDIYNAKWGTGKQRTWDSSSLLHGILHYFFGVEPAEHGIIFNPHLPDGVHSAKIAKLRVKAFETTISTHKHGDNLERSLFLRDINNKEASDMGFPIPEVGIVKTNIPGKIYIATGEVTRNKQHPDLVQNYFKTSIEIYMPFIYTTTETQEIPALSVVNPYGGYDQSHWTIEFCGEHIGNLPKNQYSLEFPSHKWLLKLSKITNKHGNEFTKISIENKSKEPLKIKFREELEESVKMQPNSVQTIMLNISTHETDISENQVVVKVQKRQDVEFSIMHSDHGHNSNGAPHSHYHLHQEKEGSDDHGHSHLHNHKGDKNHAHHHDHDHEQKGDQTHFHNNKDPEDGEDRPKRDYHQINAQKDTQSNSHEHSHEHLHTHSHTHSHGHPHAHNKQYNYPFRNKYEHIAAEKPYWKPHPLIQHLDRIMFQNSMNPKAACVLIASEDSVAHIQEIYTQFAIIKQYLLPMRIFSNEDEGIRKMKAVIEKARQRGSNIVMVHTRSYTEILGDDYIRVFSDEDRNHHFQILQHSNHKKRSNYVFYIKNSGHCYQDTHHFNQVLGTYLKPHRKKAMSMFPYGLMKLSDTIGDEIDDCFPIEIQASEDINIYLQGDEFHGTEYSGDLDGEKKMRGMKPKGNYISIYSINKYVPFEIAAGGLAQGKHNIQFVIDAFAEKKVDINLKITLPQNFHAVWLRGKQRERTLDKTQILKKSDGTKIFHQELHPGTEVHEFIRSKDPDPRSRNLAFIFGKYPRFEFL